ncbi:MAG: hypothetical protein KGM98_09160 [Bacteroidota bacterium]|nr:hypothetical protein [Bacteroidota bacterium]
MNIYTSSIKLRLSLRGLVMLGIMLFNSHALKCQDLPCPFWPAPCPNSEALTEADDYVNRSKDNVELPQELNFEKKVGGKIYNMLESAARSHGWELYEIIEESLDGPPYIYIGYADWEAAPYEKRPPQSDNITYILVVNRDSLKAWRSWRIAFENQIENSGKQYVQASGSEGDDPILKAYFDSSMHYTNLVSQYITDDEAAYAKALARNDTKYVDTHERHLKKLQAKSDAFMKKFQDQQAKDEAPAANAINNTTKELSERTKQFADASIVLVHVMINPYQVKSGLEDNEQRSLVPQVPLKVPGAYYAGLLINKNPVDEKSYGLNYQGYIFNNPAAIALILYGKYQKPDDYHNYSPEFTRQYTNAANTIKVVQKVKCDVLQNLAFQLEGSPDQVRKVISAVNWNEVAGSIGQ